MKIYLSSPYQYTRANPEWKTLVADTIAEVDPRLTVVDPCPYNTLEESIADRLLEDNDFLGYYSFCSNIVESDLAMLNQCRGVFVYLPSSSITFGTTHEIIYALDNNIPVVLVTDDDVKNISRWLWGLLGPGRVFSNIEEGAQVLAKRIIVSNGEAVNSQVCYPK